MEEKPEQEHNVFRQALGDVTPLKPSGRKAPLPPSRTLFPRTSTIAPEAADLFSEHGAGEIALTEYLGNGLNRMTLRDLRRGRWPIQDELDLHGLTLEEARKLLAAFLHQCMQRQLRCVNVIHGKGWRSDGREGILKLQTRHWLTQHPGILAFCEAPPQAGGGGAVWVLLKAA